jgi:hypothetical protein
MVGLWTSSLLLPASAYNRREELDIMSHRKSTPDFGTSTGNSEKASQNWNPQTGPLSPDRDGKARKIYTLACQNGSKFLALNALGQRIVPEA